VPCEVLVIGYGNALRGDDGIGPAVAAEIAAMALPGVRVLAVHQLTPELAANIADARRVVFVDAAVSGDLVTVTRLTAEPTPPSLTHATDPRALLALAGVLEGHAPDAWLVTARGSDFRYKEGLSEAGREQVRHVTHRVRELICPAPGP
jgi:hydrogenase maturation protease